VTQARVEAGAARIPAAEKLATLPAEQAKMAKIESDIRALREKATAGLQQ